MKTVNLYLKFHFTSLSPGAQPISLGIVSEEILCVKTKEFLDGRKPELIGVKDNTKSLYAEFSDFDINRCDDLVKENVVDNTEIGHNKKVCPEYWPVPHHIESELGTTRMHGNTEQIAKWLKEWLEQFSDYQIQFVTDCGWFNWYWMIQLLDEREPLKGTLIIPEDAVPDGMTLKEIADEWRKFNGNVILKNTSEIKEVNSYYTGLPKLPENISPVAEDLNDLIARTKGISIREAFDLKREELMPPNEDGSIWGWGRNKYNALSDAKSIKEIYNKLK